MITTYRFFSYTLILFLAVVFNAWAATSLPAVSHDGLHLVPDTKVTAVYMRPGADLSTYTKLAVLECQVAFKKDWQRKHNENISLSNRVTDQDIIDIRKRVADEFYKEFTKVLAQEDGHELVSKGGPGVLIVRPAIINLDVFAPDTLSAGMNATYGRSAGEMTLFMELLDGVTGDIIARVIDPQAGNEGGMAQRLNRVTNKAEADRIIRRWAELLNAHLGEVKS